MDKENKIVLINVCSNLTEVAGRLDTLSGKINDLNIKNKILEQMEIMIDSVAKIKETLWNHINKCKNCGKEYDPNALGITFDFNKDFCSSHCSAEFEYINKERSEG